jgi:hypothetical protein
LQPKRAAAAAGRVKQQGGRALQYASQNTTLERYELKLKTPFQKNQAAVAAVTSTHAWTMLLQGLYLYSLEHALTICAEQMAGSVGDFPP